MILREWICWARRFADVGVWHSSFQWEQGRSFSSLFQLHLSICMASDVLKGAFSHVLSKRKSPWVYWVGGGEFPCNGCVRGTCFPSSLRGIPLSSLCYKPASPHHWWTSLFGRCSYIWRLQLPTAMRLSGRDAFQECRKTLYFTLSQNNRSFPACCRPQSAAKLQEGSRVQDKLVSKLLKC